MIRKLNRYIENIKKKPDDIKFRYVWALTIVCMVFVGVIWFSSVRNSFKINPPISDDEADSAKDLANIFNDSFADLKEGLSQEGEDSQTNLFDTTQIEDTGEEAKLQGDASTGQADTQLEGTTDQDGFYDFGSTSEGREDNQPAASDAKDDSENLFDGINKVDQPQITNELDYGGRLPR